MPVPRWTLIALVVAVAAGGLVGALLLMDFDESAGSEVGTTLRDVGEDPQAFAGKEVVISGEVNEDAGLDLADADLALIIGDDTDRDVLVAPQAGAELPVGLDADTVLRVRGTVRPPGDPPPSVQPLLADGGPLAGSPPDVILEATSLEVPVSDGPTTPPRVRTLTVSRLLADPGAFSDRPLLVPGTVAAVGPRGFVLSGDGAAIFVAAPLSDLDGLSPGRRVRIRAEVERLSPYRAGRVRSAIGESGLRDVAEQPPMGSGAPFLVLRAFTTEEES